MAVGDHSESAFSIFDRLLRLWKKLLSHITLASITDVCRSPLIHFNLRNDITLFLSPKSQYSSSSSTSEYFQLLMSIAPKFTADQVFLKATCLSLICSITHFSRGILIYCTPLWPSMIINIMHSGPFHIELLAKVQNWEPQQSLCCPIECGAWVLKCRGIANSHVQHKNKKKIYIWMFRKKKGMRFIFQLDTANFGPQYESRNYFNLKNY